MPPQLPRWEVGDELHSDSEVRIVELKYPEAQYVRQLYVSKAVGQAAAQFCYAVTIDGKIAGLLMFQDSTNGFKIDGEVRSDLIYMMCDLALPAKHVPRLSKLILMAALSEEVRISLNKKLTMEFGWIATTAFSPNPVSMKYRGVMKLHNRREEGGRYAINYVAPFSGQSLQEQFQAWRSKYHKT